MPGLKLQGIITPVSTGLREMLEKEGVIEGRVSAKNFSKILLILSTP